MKFFKPLLFFTAVPTTPKYCIDCQHFIPDPNGNNRFGKCSAFPNEQVNDYFVTREITVEEITFKFCSTAREYEHLCGEKAKKYLPNLES
jgi:hypothetical protein